METSWSWTRIFSVLATGLVVFAFGSVAGSNWKSPTNPWFSEQTKPNDNRDSNSDSSQGETYCSNKVWRCQDEEDQSSATMWPPLETPYWTEDCQLLFRTIEYNGEETIIRFNHTCVLHHSDWVHIEVTHQDYNSPVINNFTYFLDDQELGIVLGPCGGVHNAGSYEIGVYYMLPNCLGSTLCDNKHTGKPLMWPMYQRVHNLSSCTHPVRIRRTPSNLNRLPHSMGFWPYDGAPEFKSLFEYQRFANSSKPMHIYLIGDSTTEQVYTALQVHQIGSTEAKSFDCHGNPSKGRPCISWFHNAEKRISVTFISMYTTLGHRPRNMGSTGGDSFRAFAPESAAQVIDVIKYRAEAAQPGDAHVVFFNMGLHYSSVNGHFPMFFEKTLLLFKKELSSLGTLVAVTTTPENTMRSSYQHHQCLTEPIVSMINEYTRCISDFYNVLVFDRYLLQRGLTRDFHDAVHLRWSFRPSSLVTRVSRVFVEAATWIANA